ncbi:transposase, partial [Nocardia amamiensis]|nr:transposase [Nocardia amamiensis]
LFFDTTSTYFETGADEPVERDDRGHPVPAGDDADGSGSGSGSEKAGGFRTYGKSKDSRDDLPQIVIGMAVTRDGIP